jgi:hypothetical protein
MFKTKRTIQNWLEKYNVQHYTINDDLTVDVNDSVNLHEMELTKICVQFGIVHGNFYCGNNRLTSMQGFPYEVRGSLFCQGNKITNFEYCPKVVFEDFNCTFNPILSIKEITSRIGGTFSHCTTPLYSKIIELDSHYVLDKKSNIERYFISLSGLELKSIITQLELQQELSSNNTKAKKLKI